MKQTMRAYFMVDDLTHLQRGGRLSGAQALIGGLLQVKPTPTFPRKSDCPVRKNPDTQKSDETHCGLAGRRRSPNATRSGHHSRQPTRRSRSWLAQLSEQLPDVKFTISHFGPVIGTHLGEGAMGLGWVKRQKRKAPIASL